jgi:hypothetical protein
VNVRQSKCRIPSQRMPASVFLLPTSTYIVSSTISALSSATEPSAFKKNPSQVNSSSVRISLPQRLRSFPLHRRLWTLTLDNLGMIEPSAVGRLCVLATKAYVEPPHNGSVSLSVQNHPDTTNLANIFLARCLAR